MVKRYEIIVSCIGAGLRKRSCRRTFVSGCFGIENMAIAFLTSLMMRFPENNDWCVESIKETEE